MLGARSWFPLVTNSLQRVLESFCSLDAELQWSPYPTPRFARKLFSKMFLVMRTSAFVARATTLRGRGAAARGMLLLSISSFQNFPTIQALRTLPYFHAIFSVFPGLVEGIPSPTLPIGAIGPFTTQWFLDMDHVGICLMFLWVSSLWFSTV